MFPIPLFRVYTKAHLTFLLTLIAFGLSQSTTGPDIGRNGSDQINDFCRRFAHRTTVLNNKVYVDGGFVNRNPLSDYPLNYTNYAMLYMNTLQIEDAVGMPKPFATSQKPSPAVAGGALWVDEINQRFYAFGGYFPSDTPMPFETWTYDDIQGSWSNVATQGDSVGYIAHGMSAVAPDAAIAYYLGGYQDNRTQKDGPSSPQYSTQLINFDMIKREYSNHDGPDSKGRGEGVMVFIPASFAGVLVYFGGVTQDQGSGEVSGAPMNEIWMFDIDLQKWYLQQASGDVPEQRKLFCGGVSWPDDKSSYNIYLYGGASITEGDGYDDVYILTIPAFVWIKVWPANGTELTGYPHHSTTCNIINGTQMLVMGGYFTTADICDSPVAVGQHNINLGYLGASKTLWDKFDPDNPPYRLPPPLVNIVGGTEKGGANVTGPENATYDEYLFEKSYKVPQRYPTPVTSGTLEPTSTASSTPPSNPNPQPPRSVLIGSIVGSIVGGICIGVAGFYLLSYLRRRQARTSAQEAQPVDEKGKDLVEMGDQPTGELNATERRELWVEPVELPDAQRELEGSDVR